jgi:Zn-dependent protease
VNEWSSVFTAYRMVRIRNDEVVQGLLLPELGASDPAVRSAMDAWGGTHFLHHTPLGIEATLMRAAAPRPRERWWLHVVLMLLTLLTTTVAGAYFRGREPLVLGPWSFPVPLGIEPSELLPGAAFSVPLMLILLGHELGHYLVARRYGLDVSPPYFIPAPNSLNLIGTFGAFIRLRSVLINRVMLLDVGAAGPIVSFLLSIPVLVAGLLLSTPIRGPVAGAPSQLVVFFGGEPLWLGRSLLVQAAMAMSGTAEGAWRLHPLALAGWLGLFVTALNLFPLAQLDGGHILYALVGRLQRSLGMVFLAVLVALGNPWWGGWWGWWFWAALVLLLGRGSIRHPPVLDPGLPVDGWRRRTGWACVVIFVLTFVPAPFLL